MGIRSCIFVICLFLGQASLLPVERTERSVSSSGPCEICHKLPSSYQPHVHMKRFGNNTICVTSSFVKGEEDSVICGSMGLTHVEVGIVPAPVNTDYLTSSCTICHNDANKVTSTQNVWSKDDGSKCVSVTFVENA